MVFNLSSLRFDARFIIGLISTPIFLSGHALAFSFSAGPAVGYEVLSYRDSPTQLTGGAVSSGDAYEQASFKGPQGGLISSIGIVRLDALEPVVGVDLLYSKLSKSAETEGVSTRGDFNFLHAGLGVGSRFWLSSDLVASAQFQFSTAYSNKMKSSKTQVSDKADLGEVTFDISGHKKTSIALGFAWKPTGGIFSFGADVRIGSGCFDCKSDKSALQHRSYLTRSGALLVALALGQETDSVPPKNISPVIQKNLPKVKKPTLPNKKQIEEKIETGDEFRE